MRAQNSQIRVPIEIVLQITPAAQIGGLACGYQPGFALSAVPELSNVRVADPYIYAQALAG
jgi:hypothetical protein